MAIRAMGDRWRRWLVLAGSFLSIFQLCVVLFGQGVLYLLLLERFGEGEARTSLVGAVYSAVFCFSGVVASALINMYSCRVVIVTGSVLHVLGLALGAFVPSLNLTILTMGLLSGLGHSFSNGGSVCVIGFYFRKERDTLMSLSSVIAGFAMMVATPFLLYIAQRYTYSEVCLILACINAHTCLYGIIAKPTVLEMESTQRDASNVGHNTCIVDILYRMKSYFDLSLILNFGYLFFLLTLTTWNFGLMVATIHLPNYMSIHGGSNTAIGSLMVSFALANTVGRMSGSFTVKKFNKHMLTAQNVILAVSGLITASFPLYAHLPAGPYIFSIQLGLFIGFPNTMMTPLSNSFVDVTKISESYGFIYIFSGFGMTLGPAVAGIIYSWTKSYSSSFILSGAMLLMGSILGVLSHKCRKPTHSETCEIKVEKVQNGLLRIDEDSFDKGSGHLMPGNEEHSMLAGEEQ